MYTYENRNWQTDEGSAIVHIFLVILKIIGITVLILLGIVITLSLLVLFVPVRYNIRADFDNDVKMRIDITWLLRVLHFRMGYPGGGTWSVRVLGIPVVHSGRAGRKKRRKHKKKVDKKKVEGNDSVKDGSSEKDGADNKVNDDTANVNTDINSDTNTNMDADENANTNIHADENANANIHADVNTNTNIDANANTDNDRNSGRKRSRRGSRGLKKHKKKITSVKSLLGTIRDDNNKRVIVFLKDIFIRLLKRVRPKKIRADMIIGFEDPANTGLLFGAIGILTVCWKGKYNITPDFEQKILKGRIIAAGYVQFVYMLYYLIKIILNEDIKRVMKKGKVN